MMLRKNFTRRQKVLTEHHATPKSSYGASCHAKKFLRSIIPAQKVLTEHHGSNRVGAPNCTTPAHRASSHGLPVTPAITYAALPASYAIVRMCALRFGLIKRLSWSLGRRLPRRCCRRRRCRLEPVRVVDGVFLLRRASGPAGPSSIVLQHEHNVRWKGTACVYSGSASRGSRCSGREAVRETSCRGSAPTHSQQSTRCMRNGQFRHSNADFCKLVFRERCRGVRRRLRRRDASFGVPTAGGPKTTNVRFCWAGYCPNDPTSLAGRRWCCATDRAGGTPSYGRRRRWGSLARRGAGQANQNCSAYAGFFKGLCLGPVGLP